MNWQIVIALILLTPLAVSVVAGYSKWTLYVWKVRSDISPPGREFWFSWVVVHVLAMALAGLCLLALEVQP